MRSAPGWLVLVFAALFGCLAPSPTLGQDAAKEPKPISKETRELAERQLRRKVSEQRERVAAMEAELKRQLQDPGLILEAETKATASREKALMDAKIRREVAEIDRVEFERGTYALEAETLAGELALAESDLERAVEHYAEDKSVANNLARQKSEFAVEIARTKLKVHKEYTRGKELKRLDAEIAQAKAKELAAKADWDEQKARQESVRVTMDHFMKIDPGSQILALYKEVDDLQVKINGILREVAGLTKSVLPDPKDGDQHLASIRKKREEIDGLNGEIRVKIRTAIALSELLRKRRDQVAAARRDLTRFEKALDSVVSAKP